MAEHEKESIWSVRATLAPIRRMRLACSTCTATSGSGARTGTTPTTIPSSRTPQALQPARKVAASCAAGRWAATAGCAARPTATGSSPASTTSTSVFGSSASCELHNVPALIEFGLYLQKVYSVMRELTRLLELLSCLLALAGPGVAGAAEKVVPAGGTLTLAENLVLTGADTLEIRGTADKP